MKALTTILGLGLLAASLQASALLEDLNHFALNKAGSSCVLQLEPERDALNISFTSPDTLVIRSSYEFIGGSGIKITFGDGTELSLQALPSSSSRLITATIPADKMAAFASNKHVRIGSESIRGPLFRNIRLRDFAASYSGLQACTTK